jgi:hypothetical protein
MSFLKTMEMSIVTYRILSAVWLGVMVLITGCGGSDSDTSTSTSFGVTLPSITTQPVSQSIVEGKPLTLNVVATGSGTLSYQWRKGGSEVNGATASTFSVSNVIATDTGSYDVVVSNSSGSVTSSAATVTVTAAAPVIATQPVSQSVIAGTAVTFSTAATGTGPLNYQWRREGVAIIGANSSTFTISSVSSADAGNYDVVVSNEISSVNSGVAVLSVTANTSGVLSTAVANTASAFYASLNSSQQSTSQLAWSLDNARQWSNLPAALVARNGIAWGNLSAAQKTAARSMIQSALSSTGDTLHQGLQAADDYLAANGGGSSYGNGQFYIAFLGTPTSTGFWMLQLTGHHLTYNIAFNGIYKSPTPLFLGIEPKGSFTQDGKTYDPMVAQRTAVASLGAALTAYPNAKLTGTYSDLLFGANGTSTSSGTTSTSTGTGTMTTGMGNTPPNTGSTAPAGGSMGTAPSTATGGAPVGGGGGSIDGTCPRAYATVTEHGLLYTTLPTSVQALVQTVISSYVNTQSTEYANDLMSAYLSTSALAQTYVAYAGSGTITTQGNYFRIEGPRLWIEFSVQNGVVITNDIHFHTIWRDKLADYGGKCVS